jgi:hypothetical protein
MENERNNPTGGRSMGIKINVFIVLSLMTFFVFANGGPIFDYNIGSTGNIRFIKKSNLKLLKEDLQINIEDEKTHFKIKYIFQNIGGDEKIQFAFPMETKKEGVFYEGEEVKKKIETFIERKKVDSYQISINRKKINYSKKSETIKLEHEGYEIREWFVSEVEFKKFEKAEIFISYTIESYRDIHLHSCSTQPKISERTLQYDFSPASFFGDGMVSDLNVVVDFTDLKKINGKFIKSEGLEFIEQKPGVIEFTGKNIDFNKVKGVLLTYDIKSKDRKEYIGAKRMLPEKFKIIKPAIPLSQLKRLFDFNAETSLCLEKENKIEFLFDEANLPGYGAIVLSNHKADKFRIYSEVYCSIQNTDPIDEKISFEYSSDKFRYCNLCSNSECEIKERKNCNLLTDCADDLFDLGDYDPTKVKECRLKIRIETVESTKNAPCISEILLLPHYQGD